MSASKLISLNIRGLRDKHKRFKLYTWLKDKNYDVILLQETHSTPSDEQMWRDEWGGDIYFAHGKSNSAGTAVLCSKHIKSITINKHKADENGYFNILFIDIESHPYLLVNTYSPTNDILQEPYYQTLNSIIKNSTDLTYNNIIIGGDFNNVLNKELDRLGGNYKIKRKGLSEIVKIIDDFELVDVYRDLYPNERRFTWKQNSPPIHSRIDYWFITESNSHYIKQAEIIPSLLSDHSAILIEINHTTQKKGPKLWIFNSSLTQDKNYINLINQSLETWEYDFSDKTDRRGLWDFLKYKIKQETIIYCKKKQKVKKQIKQKLEEEYEQGEVNLSVISEDSQKLAEHEIIKTRLNEIYNEEAQGAIIRSKLQDYHEGDKNSKFFLSLENQKQNSTCIYKLQSDSENFLLDKPKDVLTHIEQFYKKLYSLKTETKTSYIDFLKFNIDHPRLELHEADCLEGKLSDWECQEVLKSFKLNASPGNDGLTYEFYSCFWPIIGNHVLNSFNEGFDEKCLSNSQRQSIIKLVPKPGKNKLDLGNWRPISLINVDTKIASKSLYNRVKFFLKNLIHPNQTGFIPGRHINENIRIIDDCCTLAQQRRINGMILAIDFSKAYDSLNSTYLLEVLRQFGFKKMFLRWISTLYNKIECSVMNNGYTTKYFPIERGVRQGDPISPILFNLAIEILCIFIRNDKNYSGISFGDKILKIIAFADDLTCLIKDFKTARHLIEVLNQFKLISGLSINLAKTEAFDLNSGITNLENEINSIGLKFCTSSIKILGIFFSLNSKLRTELNFEGKIREIENVLKRWKTRKLTLSGKNIIIKTFCLSKLSLLLQSLFVPEYIIKKLSTIFFGFLWNGPDKIKRDVIYQPCEKGGIKFINIKEFHTSKTLFWIKKLFHETVQPWLTTLNFSLHPAEPLLLTVCNSNNATNKIHSPFYKQLFNNWHDLFNKHIDETIEIQNQIIFLNKHIDKEHDTTITKSLINKNLIFISNFIEPYNIETLSEVDKLIYHGYRTKSLKLMKTIDNNDNTNETININPILIDKNLPDNDLYKQRIFCILQTIFKKLYNLDFMTCKTRQIYNKRLHTNQFITPTAFTKWQTELNIDLTESDIKEVFKRIHCICIDAKIKNFQYKYVHKIIYTNIHLFKFKLTDTTLCTFCSSDLESGDHLFIYCPFVHEIWNHIRNIIEINNINIQLNNKTIHLGIDQNNFENINQYQLINHIIILGKYFIFKCKCSNSKPSLNHFIPFIKAQAMIETKLNPNLVDKWKYIYI